MRRDGLCEECGEETAIDTDGLCEECAATVAGGSFDNPAWRGNKNGDIRV